jgi:hypothetical protein
MSKDMGTTSQPSHKEHKDSPRKQKFNLIFLGVPLVPPWCTWCPPGEFPAEHLVFRIFTLTDCNTLNLRHCLDRAVRPAQQFIGSGASILDSSLEDNKEV